MALMAKNNAYWVPTLQTLKFESNAHKASFLDNPNLDYISSVRKNSKFDDLPISSIRKKKNIEESDFPEEFVSPPDSMW